MDDRPHEVEAWLRKWGPDQREQVDWLVGRVHAAGAGVEEAVKWGRLTFTVGGNWHHWLCAVAVAARRVSLVFHKGSLLDDPAGLLEGEGRYLRQVPYDRAAEAPEAIIGLVRQAIARQTEMLD